MAIDSDVLRVEFLRAWEDGTWDTVCVDVPEAELQSFKVTGAGDDAETLQRWVGEHLRDRVEYRKVVAWAVYAVDPS